MVRKSFGRLKASGSRPMFWLEKLRCKAILACLKPQGDGEWTDYTGFRFLTCRGSADSSAPLCLVCLQTVLTPFLPFPPPWSLPQRIYPRAGCVLPSFQAESAVLCLWNGPFPRSHTSQSHLEMACFPGSFGGSDFSLKNRCVHLFRSSFLRR